MTEIKIKLKVPTTPNFINTEENTIMICIGKLSDEQLIGLADEWKKELLAKAVRLRKAYDE